MAGLLARVLEALDAEKKGHFCFRCGAPVVRTEQAAAKEAFHCAGGHEEERSFLFDGKAVWSVEEGRLIHESSGALVRREGGVLLFHRRKYPRGWSIPAGHVEVDADPEAEMRREVLEEVGLAVVRSRRVWPGEPVLLSDRCRRGADLHRWHLFDVEAAGEVRVGDEGDDFGWFPADELEALDLVPPVREIFRRLREA